MSKKSERKLKRTYRHRMEFSTHEYDCKCIFCGSTDITIHHVVFKRFAPELDKDTNNHVPMCSRCQRIYHQLTDRLLDYLKLNTHQIDNHEIRLPKPIPPSLPPTPLESTTPTITISGGEVTINFK